RRDCAGRFCFHAAGTDEFSHLPLARAAAYIIANVYAIKMAAVFMVSTSTVVIRTDIAPRWIAFLGFLLALILLMGSFFISWSFAILPFWVFLISVYILIDNLGGSSKVDGG